MRFMQIANRLEGLDSLFARLADADQDAGGERHLQFAGQPDRLQAHRRMLVGRAEMDAALFTKSLAGRFEHDALAGGDSAQRGDLLARHDAGIGVRQQAGLAQHQAAHRGQILDRGSVAERGQRIARRGVAQLRLVTQGEQRLGAARRLARAGDGEDLIGRQVGRLAGARPFGEGAVMADVAAQMGQRNEDLARIRDQPAVALIAQPRRVRHQLRKLRHDQISSTQSRQPCRTIATIARGRIVYYDHHKKALSRGR